MTGQWFEMSGGMWQFFYFRNMNWSRTLIIIERFERVTRLNLHELQLLLLDIDENGSLLGSKNMRAASQKIDQLLGNLQQGAINALNEIAAAETPEWTNIYDDLYEKSLLAETAKGDELQEEKQIRINLLLLQAKEAKTNAIKDAEDLNEMMMQLAQLVHIQHDVVDSIEEHIEKAQTHKQSSIPATVGSIAMGGPVGFVAGFTVAGIFAAFGGAVAGVYSGNYFRQKVQETASRVNKN
uniref:t-SNARE coiled-coil homology domain-containing protein n=1 Tax=Loa loa TaxID=7209 RepID=A0A1I7VHH1_LOALO